MRARIAVSALVAGLALVTACAHVPKRSALPAAIADDATVLGIPRARL
ncbi:MAG: hypothetical protein WCE62_15270 [Polyangiales bacterium]